MRKIVLILFTIVLISCSNEPSLQKYFVENSENPDFINIDIASSVINVEKISLTSEEKQALASFEKLNILAFKKDSLDNTKLLEEKDNLKKIFNTTKYQELMKFGNSKNSASVYLVGEEESIDEVVLYASGKEEGFVVARVLGDNMNPNNVLNLIEVIRKADLNLEQLKPLQDALGNK